uniref:hypothetical protein n=1 Tax=Maribacter litoralis TaxID=2059726 RepID=UPI003F5CEAAC
MRKIFTAFLLISLLFFQTMEAQRGTQSRKPVSTSTRENFTALSQEHIEKTINLLGINLGQSLADAKKTIENNGGEIIWLASPDPNYVRSTKELQRDTSLDYFEYAVHSIKNPNNKNVRHTPNSREDIVVKITVYPKSAGNLKDPNNLIIYKADTYLGFQPTYHQVTYNNIKNIEYTYADFHAVMKKNNYTLYQHQNAHLSYSKNRGKSLDIGNLKAARGTWKGDNIKIAPSYNLISISAFFPTYKSDLMQPNKNGGDPIITYKPLSQMIDEYQGSGAFQTYLDYGNSVVLDLIQIESKIDPSIYLLNNLNMHYQNASLMEDAYNGFYNALFKD